MTCLPYTGGSAAAKGIIRASNSFPGATFLAKVNELLARKRLSG